MINKKFNYFKNREERAMFIASNFKKYIDQSQTILDVGCDNNVFKKIVGNKVTGIDIYGEPDILVDLEKNELKQFEDAQFDFVICTEVLEHLESFYSTLDELVRISRKYVLISLPNCLDFWTKYNILIHGKIGKFYGLPMGKPDDRHRWIFTWKDLDIFFKNYCEKNNLKIQDNFLHFNFSQSIKGKIMRALVSIFNLKSASQSYWILISK